MKPCELVSGDFFWATSFNEFQIFCVADCTGHGVPGAFMSILGITALNDIVANHRVTKANEVLGYLRSSVIETLSQNDPGHLHKDGMDIGLCIYNTNSKELQFAGARIPLWMVAKNDATIDWGITIPNDSFSQKGHTLTEIKGDIMPVGTSPRMEPFRNNTIILNKNSVTLYLATDGFADQFGGENRTKFGANRLKNHLLEIEHLSASEKKQSIEGAFDSWKGLESQIDDTVVLGIRI
jgi:serine phosphatase RsbU (regulator of sigma subunit)